MGKRVVIWEIINYTYGMKKRAIVSKKQSDQVKPYVRPSWDEYFIQIAEMVGSRATCDRGRSGCVVTKDKRILVTGYVGSPIGIEHCDEVGHEISRVINDDGTESKHCIRTIHAEQNAITQAARNGISINGGTLYCHMTPCYTCAKMIINAGIKRVVANLDYHRGQRSVQMFKQADVEFVLLNAKVEEYTHQK